MFDCTELVVGRRGTWARAALTMRLASALDSVRQLQLSTTDADFQRPFELDSRGAEPEL